MIDFGEHAPEKKHLDLTPMIDVVFLLLIFFLLTSIFSKPSIPLDLPRAESARQTGEPAVSVAVKRDGTILLDGAPVAREALQGALAERYGRGGKKGRRTRPPLSTRVPASPLPRTFSRWRTRRTPRSWPPPT